MLSGARQPANSAVSIYDSNKALSVKDVKTKIEIEKLRDELRRHDHLYYVINSPEITDQEYDRLYRKLKDLEDANPEFITPDSPTRRVGGQPVKGFHSVKHIAPMMRGGTGCSVSVRGSGPAHLFRQESSSSTAAKGPRFWRIMKGSSTNMGAMPNSVSRVKPLPADI